MRSPLLILIACALCAGEVDPPAPKTPPGAPPVAAEAITPALTAFAARAVELGLPDAAGGQLVVGTLTLTPPAGQAAAPMPMGPQQQGGPMLGIHVRLADGRWLPQLGMLPPAGWTVDASATTPVPAGADPLAVLRTHLADAKDPSDEEQGKANTPAAWQALQARQQEVRLRQALDELGKERRRRHRGLHHVITGMSWSNDTTPAVVCLVHMVRIGSPLAAALGQEIHEERARLDGPWRAPGAFSAERQRGHSWSSGRNREAGPPPEESWRQQLHLAFRRMLAQQITRLPQAPEPALPAERAAASAIALLVAADPAHHREAVDLLLKATAIVVPPPKDADLATRLAAWNPEALGMFGRGDDDEGEEQVARMREMLANEIPAEMKAMIQAQLALAERRIRFTDAERDGMVALLDDPRPSVVVEDGRGLPQPRTVGDQALRALIARLGFDPRPLVGRDPDAAWTAAERTATAQALSAWWKAAPDRSPGALLAQGVGKMAPQALATALQRLPADKRAPALAALATAWAKPPAVLTAAGGRNDRWERPQELQAIGQVLALAGKDAGIEAVVAKWPVAGQGALLLSVWHAQRGRQEHLDQLFDTALAVPAGEDWELRQQQEAVTAAAMALPTAPRLGRLVTALRGPLNGMAMEMVGNVLMSHTDFGVASPLLQNRSGIRMQAEGLQPEQLGAVALARSILDDRRPAPAGMVKVDNDGDLMIQIGNSSSGLDKVSGKPAADLRLCDVAGAMLGNRAWQFGLPHDAFEEQGKLDLTAALPAREAALTVMREKIDALLTPALKAAGLPALPPPDAAAPKNPDALF